MTIAPGFRGEFFAARQVDGIVERRAGDLPRSDRTRISAHGSLVRHVDPALSNGALQLAALVREIREQIDIGIEGHHQRFIAFADDAPDELAPCVLYGRQHVLLAAGSVEQKR